MLLGVGIDEVLDLGYGELASSEEA